MHLTPQEIDKISITAVGSLALNRLSKGIRLNIPETVALISMLILERARVGVCSVSQLMDYGKRLIGYRQVIPGVADVVSEIQIEATFRDGTKLVTVHSPISQVDGDLDLVFEYSIYKTPDLKVFEEHEEEGLIPGEVITLVDDLVINSDREVRYLKVSNTCDRPIQVGSHYHFIETNKLLQFDRIASYGYRLNIASGTSVRFEPGESKTVGLVMISGGRVIRGGNNLASGPIDLSLENIARIKNLIREKGFLDIDSSINNDSDPDIKRQKIINFGLTLNRKTYASMYGPTVGDVIRLGDTDLFIRIEKDFAVLGDECKFGGGKVIREGMGQSTGIKVDNQLDLVITNAIIIDHSGIVKADIGVKKGRIIGIGKAGNPDVMSGVDPQLVIGVNTEVISAEGLIVTAGAVDSHVHFICPQLCEVAVASGITTLLGGGTGPSSGTSATTCTPSPSQIRMMLRATDDIPVNIALTGKGNTSDPEGLVDVIRAGAVGLKLHEDWGSTPAAIECCLSVAQQEGVQVTIHTDTLNESCCVEGTIAAIAGRSIHTYHSEGAGGGHAPDIITVCSLPNVIPSSTNPTRPLTINTIDEHLDMLMVCHHLSQSVPEDIAFAESRIRRETIAAEDILHDLGAISIVSSDSQAMGRIGEVITRTWQTAHKMKQQRGQLVEDEVVESAHPSVYNKAGIKIFCDNYRVRRYVAKYTINPAIAHGLSDHVGSVEVGKLADLVLWRPSYFGVKPEMVLKGGDIVWSQMGDANASIPTPQPVVMRRMFGAYSLAVGDNSIAFVSQRCVREGVGKSYGLKKSIVSITDTRSVGKEHMKLNDFTPKITVDPETYEVKVDDAIVTCEPATTLPLTQRYYIY